MQSDRIYPKLIATPIAIEDYLERERNHAERRKRKGWSRGYARQNQLLPYAGTGLSDGEAEQLFDWLRLVSSRQMAISDPLAAALLSAVLTTGRPVGLLAQADIVSVDNENADRSSLETGEQWLWWLPPGRPQADQIRDRKNPDRQPAHATRIAIPVSNITRQLLELAGIGDHAGVILRGGSGDLDQRLVAILRKAGLGSPLSFCGRWLFERLARMKGGDVALAAIVTGQVPPIAATVIHYTMIDSAEVSLLIKRGLEGFDSVEPAEHPTSVPLGSRYAPGVDETSTLVVCLRRSLDRSFRVRPVSIETVHNAMTLYTVAFALFATGHRPGRSLLVDQDAIDTVTGCLLIDDKPTADNFKTRLIWVNKVCREQLALYRLHCAALARLRPELPNNIDTKPILFGHANRPVALTRKRYDTELKQHDWPFPPQAGRHFLRSQLSGVLPTDMLHAFLGHWHLGTEPWSAKAALDPVAYRMMLDAALSPLLKRIGFEPMRGLA